jgi:hypothetical protein
VLREADGGAVLLVTVVEEMAVGILDRCGIGSEWIRRMCVSQCRSKRAIGLERIQTLCAFLHGDEMGPGYR